MSQESKCPMSGARPTTAGAHANAQWWPDQLNLKILHQHSPKSDPMAKRSTTRKNSNPSISMPSSKTCMR